MACSSSFTAFVIWAFRTCRIALGNMLILPLAHWGRVTHICISELATIGSDNGLSPGRRQDIIRTNAGILLIGYLVTNFREIVIEIHTFWRKLHFKMSSAKRQPFCIGLRSYLAFRHMASLWHNELNSNLTKCLWRTKHTHSINLTSDHLDLSHRVQKHHYPAL